MRRVTPTLLILALAATTTMSHAHAPPRLEIVELPPPRDVDATTPWVKSVGGPPSEDQPTFEIADPQGRVSAKGWLAMDGHHLRVRVDVTDPVHANDKTGGDIWDGDFIRIAVDARGDGAAGGPPDTAGLFGPDDASIGFALTPAGPQGWTYATDVKQHEGAYPAELLTFARDDGKKLTRYDVRIPWARLGVPAGAFPTFGIVVQVRNVDAPGQPDATQIRWGDGANEPRPGLFKRVAVGNPPGELAAVVASRAEIWYPTDAAEAVVAVAGNDRQIVAAAGEHRATRDVVSSDGRVHRYAVRYRPAAPGAAAAPLTVSVSGTEASATLTPVVADAVVRQLYDRLDALIAASTHELFTRHLRSVRAMVQAEWARATLYKRDNPATARETLGYVRTMLDGLADGAPATKWASYASGQRPLFFAYTSRRDGTLQWYTVTLPDGWDERKARDEQPPFPLFVELHGAGNAHYLNHVQAFLSNKPSESLPRTYAQIDRAGYHVFPFGRGNSGYRDIGEIDVWETYADAHKTFRIDEDRRYLYGFSMGGSGTWNLGVRTPDRWAAVAILGMGPNTMPEIGLARNVATLPVYFWAGEDDRVVFRGERPPKAQIAAFEAELRKHGGSPVVTSTPGVGHNYLGERQKEAHEFLKGHVRRRPGTFSFVADTAEHRGVWGIAMTRDLGTSGAPRFTCAIEGQTVRIDSEGTPGLEVDLGPDGLRMQGTVAVDWNGKRAYEGPVNEKGKPVRLGTPAPARGR